MFACEAVDLDFLATAPIPLRATVNVGRPPSEVFAALHMTRPTGASFSPASTDLAVGRHRDRMALGLATRSGSSASRLRNRYSSGMKALALRSVSTARPHRRFTPGLRTTTLSRTATTALCCVLPSAASRDLSSNWPHLYCRAPLLS
jgi:hypothetical protein